MFGVQSHLFARVVEERLAVVSHRPQCRMLDPLSPAHISASPVSSLDVTHTASLLQPQHCIVVRPSTALQPLPLLCITQPHGSLPAGAAAAAAAAKLY
jgi:hypothetical protein